MIPANCPAPGPGQGMWVRHHSMCAPRSSVFPGATRPKSTGRDHPCPPNRLESAGPGNRISGGKVLSSRTRRSSGRAAALLGLAAVTIGRTDTAPGAFYRRPAARAGKAKAVTATARRIAVLFCNTLRHGRTYQDPGASHFCCSRHACDVHPGAR